MSVWMIAALAIGAWLLLRSKDATPAATGDGKTATPLPSPVPKLKVPTPEMAFSALQTVRARLVASGYPTADVEAKVAPLSQMLLASPPSDEPAAP